MSCGGAGSDSTNTAVAEIDPTIRHGPSWICRAIVVTMNSKKKKRQKTKEKKTGAAVNYANGKKKTDERVHVVCST